MTLRTDGTFNREASTNPISLGPRSILRFRIIAPTIDFDAMLDLEKYIRRLGAIKLNPYSDINVISMDRY